MAAAVQSIRRKASLFRPRRTETAEDADTRMNKCLIASIGGIDTIVAAHTLIARRGMTKPLHD